MSRWKTALRALKNLCSFIGAAALFSFFYNWTIDLQHWYVTLASAVVCSILWLGFYFVEVHKEAVNRVSLSLRRAALARLSRLRTKQAELPFTVATEPGEKLPELLWPKRFLQVC